MNIDPKWHKDVISTYLAEYPIYVTYARVLAEVLQRACGLYAPLSIVQAREKSVSSFAEKAARKAFKYADPVHQITDLCGARVITRTQPEVDMICGFIRSSFVVDEKNSLDVRTRLKEMEFGYLSVHYVVQLRGPSILGVAIPPEIGDRKAEIQVRTLLQHAWADNTHDRLYKSDFKVPAAFLRQGALLAASLENADGEFDRFNRGLDAYVGNYAAWMTRDKMREEIDILSLILRNEPKPPNRPKIALRIARIAKAAGDHAAVVSVLNEFKDIDHKDREAVLLEMGSALVRLHRHSPQSDDFRAGQAMLEQACTPSRPPGPPVDRQSVAAQSEALSMLAWSFAQMPGQECQARDRYRQALQLEPASPYHLLSQLEYEIYCTRNIELVSSMRPTLTEAIRACRSHIDVGIELPRAHFAIARLNLLMGRTHESLVSYAKGIQLCLSADSSVSPEVLADELEFLSRINVGRALPPEHRWVQLLLTLARAAGNSTGPALQPLSTRKAAFTGPVLILAGGASQAVEKEMQHYRADLVRMLSGFRGTVISGGTRAGVPGLLGDVIEQAGDSRSFVAIGYLPRNLPVDVSKDNRYDEIIVTSGDSVGLLEPLQYWIDLLAAGMSPRDVRLVGINGSQIAAFEYRLALALGARVGVVEASGRAADELYRDADWAGAENLMHLPADSATLCAFVHSGRTDSPISPAALDRLGQLIHDKYLQNGKHVQTDPAMRPWPDLPEDLKQSNRQQAAYAARILVVAGYGVRPAASSATATAQFSPEEINLMAEMEHGRWNCDRLQNGWRFGPVRDLKSRISPYLVPWANLPPEVQEYDRQAVVALPQVLRSVGLEVYRLAESVAS